MNLSSADSHRRPFTVNRRISLGLMAVAVSAVPLAATATAEEPAAPAPADQVVQYYESGEFNTDLKKVTDSATKSLKSQLKKKPKKPAIVFDIDDTLESTYECAKKSNFDRTQIGICQANNEQTPIAPVWKLLKLAQKNKVAIVVITGRPQGIEPGTRQKLKADGLKGKYTLVMRPNGEFGKPARPYKTAARKAIAKKGYKILVNIGDQRSDLDGNPSGKKFKVPNPMYFTP
jgi:predicted secreted acid phosphatase